MCITLSLILLISIVWVHVCTCTDMHVCTLHIHDYVVANIIRHEDLKMMLDNNKDSQKLDAMKMIIGVSMWSLVSFWCSMA